MTEVIDRCRICENPSLTPVLDLGAQALTSVFPRTPDEPVPAIPLELVKCEEDGAAGACGLVQLRHTSDLGLMYGEHYGYRSGLNQSMVAHLRRTVAALRTRVDLGPGDLVLDIGSNDGTLLRAYPEYGLTLVGVDATGEQFRASYPPHIALIADFFSRDLVTARFGDRKAKVVTTIATFYDLPRPLQFMQDVHDLLADDGIWVLEQSYLPAMLDNTSYDTVCHEHLEYYALRQIEWMAERVGLTIIAAELTEVYGGSCRVTLAKRPSRYPVDEGGIERIRAHEAELGLRTTRPLEAFARRVREHRDALRAFVDDAQRAGKLTLGYGASTKGNVLLQFCGLDAADLPCIAEVNEDKFGRCTPGTGIPIVSEAEARRRCPDQFLVLPWQYRPVLVERERDFLARGGHLVFPLPRLAVV